MAVRAKRAVALGRPLLLVVFLLASLAEPVRTHALIRSAAPAQSSAPLEGGTSSRPESAYLAFFIPQDQSNIGFVVHVNPVNGVDPSGREFTVAGQVGLMGNIGTVTRFTTKVLRTAYKAKTTFEFMRDMLEFGNYLLSGEFTALIRSRIQDSIGVTKSVDVNEAVKSLLRHTDTLILRSSAAWGPWMVASGKNVDRLVIYMPTVPSVLYFETKIPKPSRLKVDFVLGFGAGSEEKTNKNKAGRLTGVGLKGDRLSKQIWRMDIHPAHDIRGTGDHAYFTDPPFHYHVLRPGR